MQKDMDANMPSGAVSREQYQQLVTRYNNLAAQYRDLKGILSKQKEYVKKADEKYKAAKENARLWQAYIDSHACSCESHAGSSRRHSRVQADNDVGNDERETRVNKHIAANSTATHEISSSQTTEGDQDEIGKDVQEQESDDTPQVVSFRAVKRKRSNSTQNMPPPTRVKQEPTSPNDPIELPSEDFSSPVLKREKPIRTQTSDLDALVDNVHTPRSHRRHRATSDELVRPTLAAPVVSSLSEGDVLDMGADDVQIKVEAEPDRQNSSSRTTARDFAVQPGSKATKNIKDKVLRQISPNVPTTPRAVIDRAGMKRRQRHSDEDTKFAILSEDGDEQRSQVTAPAVVDIPNANISHRLDTLLDKPSPHRQPLPRRHTPDPKTAQTRQRQPSPIGRRHDTRETFERYEARTLKRPTGVEESPPPVDPEDEPLRARPLKILRLEDFKINPKYMGVDYAFAGSVRGREQRRCLQGCTRPDCCGDAFRKVVELGGVQSTKNDSEVLKDFLGPSYATIMGAHGPEKRNDLLMQARAHAFANQYGKHRHAFERRSTPPGFWRTDMPSTQEEQQDRAKAQEMERKKVEERWRDAMREGGRWMFRDE